MRQSEIDKRARRTVPKQCVSDHGMHKDSPKKPWISLFRSFSQQRVWPELIDNKIRRLAERDRDE